MLDGDGGYFSILVKLVSARQLWLENSQGIYGTVKAYEPDVSITITVLAGELWLTGAISSPYYTLNRMGAIGELTAILLRQLEWRVVV